MFYSWVADKEQQHEMYHDYGTFIGGFSNPEMAKQIWDAKNPKFASTDEEFEKSSLEVIEIGKRLQQKPKHRRKRRVLNK